MADKITLTYGQLCDIMETLDNLQGLTPRSAINLEDCSCCMSITLYVNDKIVSEFLDPRNDPEN